MAGHLVCRLLHELKLRRATVTTVLETPPSLAKRLSRSTPFTRGGQNPARSVRALVSRPKAATHAMSEYSALSPQLLLTGTLNSERMKQDLRRLQPDFIILGGLGILHESVIRLARYGVINCHPALLPWVRGTGVVGGSIHRGIPVGCTCHYVDSGIDTGTVIERRLLPVTSSELSLSALEQAANALATVTLADVVAEQVMRGTVPVAMQQPPSSPITNGLRRKSGN